MPEVVKPNHADPGGATSCLKAARDLCPVERLPKMRVGDDKVIIAVERGTTAPQLELRLKPVAQRHGPSGAEVGLTFCGVLAAYVHTAYADALGAPVHVPPTQAEQFGLA